MYNSLSNFIKENCIKFSLNTKFKEKFVYLTYEDIDSSRYYISNMGRIYDIRNNKYVSFCNRDCKLAVDLYKEDGKLSKYYIYKLIAGCFVERTPIDIFKKRDKVKVLNGKKFGITDKDIIWVNTIDVYIRNCYDYTLDIEAAICRCIDSEYTNEEIKRLLPVYMYAKNTDRYINKIRERVCK